MRRVSSLPRLHRAVLQRVLVLRGLVGRAQQLVPSAQREALIAFATIELHNTWSLFVRSFYVSCACGAYNGRGHRITATTRRVRSANDAIDLAVRVKKKLPLVGPPRAWDWNDEPTWHNSSIVVSVAASAGLTNLAEIQAVYSTRDLVFADLPTFRHFFAHRSGSTMRDACARAIPYGISSMKRPAEILLTRGLCRHQPVILDWMDSVLFSAEYLCC